MAKGKRTGIELTAYDDIFETDESRAEAALSKIRDIPLAEIDEFQIGRASCRERV